MVECHTQPSEIMAMDGEALRLWSGCIDEYLKLRKQANAQR